MSFDLNQSEHSISMVSTNGSTWRQACSITTLGLERPVLLSLSSSRQGKLASRTETAGQLRLFPFRTS